MKILLIGSGGREHALAWKLVQSPQCEILYCAPGNPGIAAHAQCVDIKADDIDTLVTWAQDHKIDFVVVGPEAPLVKGLADRLRNAGIPVFGPSQAAAQLEGSKGFTKDLCTTYDIPTAAYGRFTDVAAAQAFIDKHGAPIVIKADGLAAGKGVIIAETVAEAKQAAQDMLTGGQFGKAGAEIVIEEFLDGKELSYFALSDGKTMLPLTSAQDHKRVFDGDEGPNTGGMGAYSPAYMMTPDLEQKILTRIIQPTIDGMAADGHPFTGVLFAGIMVVKGEPYLIEYNVRFGDPECQTLMMRLEGDLMRVLKACADGDLANVQDEIHWSNDPALCVVMATKGYPGSYPKNTVIKNVKNCDDDKTIVFHAGTRKDESSGDLLSTGGRVLGVTAKGLTISEAHERAYKAVDTIDWPDGFCRRDIGWQALRAAE